MTPASEAPPAPDEAGQATEPCPQCGSPLQADQEWCLECGAARTIVHGPPDWRIPTAIVSTVLLAALVAAAIALINLSSSADTQAVAAAARTSQGSAPQAPTSPGSTSSSAGAASATGPGAGPLTTASPAAGSGGRTAGARRRATTGGSTTSSPAIPTPLPASISSWPIGLPGWTVVLASFRTERAAVARASLDASRGLTVGVLDSSQHPSMTPGRWVVFSGRYPTQAEAASAAQRLKAIGYARARARIVGRPGG